MTPEAIADKLFRYQGAARARGAYTDCACPSQSEVEEAISEFGRAALRERDAAHEIALKKARADAMSDAIAVVEAWWRSKGRRLQNTHAPNLASARIEATEVDELLRRLRAWLEVAGK